MIIYHPAFDAHHGALRIFSICKSVGMPLEVEKLQIVDFYLVFPEHLISFRLPKKFIKWKRFPIKIDNGYKNKQHQKTLFLSYLKTSRISMEMLLAKGLINDEAYNQGVVELSSVSECEELDCLSEQFNNRMSDYFCFISQLAGEVSLYGRDGLKDRSGLLEYRNDVI